MTTQKRVYEPPIARDLSLMRARGGTVTPLGGGIVPLGICTAGAGISNNYTCTRGTGPTSDPSSCKVGTNPTLGGCGKGNYAESFCQSGATD